MLNILDYKTCDKRTKTWAPYGAQSLSQKYIRQCFKIFYSNPTVPKMLIFEQNVFLHSKDFKLLNLDPQTKTWALGKVQSVTKKV